MYTSLKFLSLAALLGLAAAAPANNTSSDGGSGGGSGGARIVVKNQCGYDLNIGKLTNGQSSPETSSVSQGSEKTYNVDGKWQGRFWGRKSGGDNPVAGAANPASLAEFTFKGSGGNDYYDVSFVDGFNLPISIEPINPSKSGGSDNGEQYHCGKPTCSKLPECPGDLKGDDGTCKSACSKYNTEEFCCSGSHNTPDTCPPNKFSKAVKDSCPDAYSYAYDDKKSTYMCQSEGYTVTFCPN